MALNKVQIDVAERVGKLLADSPLGEEIKTALMANMDKIPEHMIFKLLDVLENEQEELNRMVFEMDLFLKQQDKKWSKVGEEQQRIANALADKWVEKLK